MLDDLWKKGLVTVRHPVYQYNQAPLHSNDSETHFVVGKASSRSPPQERFPLLPQKRRSLKVSFSIISHFLLNGRWIDKASSNLPNQLNFMRLVSITPDVYFSFSSFIGYKHPSSRYVLAFTENSIIPIRILSRIKYHRIPILYTLLVVAPSRHFKSWTLGSCLLGDATLPRKRLGFTVLVSVRLSHIQPGKNISWNLWKDQNLSSTTHHVVSRLTGFKRQEPGSCYGSFEMVVSIPK